MQLTHSFLDLLQHFTPVFTAPTFRTFLQIALNLFSGPSLAHVSLPGLCQGD